MSIEIELPEDLQSFVADRTREEGHTSASDFIVALIKEARQERLLAKLKERVDALDRGEGQPMTDQDWEEIRSQVRTNLTARGSNGCPN